MCHFLKLYYCCLNVVDISISDVTEDDDMAEHIVIGGIDFWIPKIPDEIKPRVKGHYPSKDAIEEMYYKYALEAGFDVRRNTERKKMVLAL